MVPEFATLWLNDLSWNTLTATHISSFIFFETLFYDHPLKNIPMKIMLYVICTGNETETKFN